MQVTFKKLFDARVVAGTPFAGTLPAVFGGPSTLVNKYTVQAGQSMYVYQHIYEGEFAGAKVSFRSNLVYRARTPLEIPLPAFGF